MKFKETMHKGAEQNVWHNITQYKEVVFIVSIGSTIVINLIIINIIIISIYEIFPLH